MCVSGPAWWAVRRKTRHRRTGGVPAAAYVAAREEEERCDRTRSRLCELTNAAAADQSESLQQRRIRSTTTARAGRAQERDKKLGRRLLIAAQAPTEIYDGDETQKAWRAIEDVSGGVAHGATDPLSQPVARTWASGLQLVATP